MAITSYSELQTAVANWMQRSDLTSRIPEFIALAEAKFNRGFLEDDPFYASAQEAQATATATEFMSFPTDFGVLRTIKVLSSPIRNLDYLPPQDIDQKFTSAASGIPKFYSIQANQIRIVPAPDSTYTVKLDYFQKITPLATTSPNWLLTAHPDIYLYGSLLESAGFAQDDPRIPLWKEAYQRACSSLKNHQNRLLHSGSVLQVRLG